MTPSMTAWPPTIKSRSFVLNVFSPIGKALSPMIASDENRPEPGLLNTNAGLFLSSRFQFVAFDGDKLKLEL